MGSFTRRGYIVDIPGRNIFYGEVTVEGSRISQVIPLEIEPIDAIPFIIPGFIDSHVHIESSMLTPSEFARLAVVHGTVATISDPHEIANVCGIEGVEFMISNGKKVPFKFYFGAPSCVPATGFETAGAVLNAEDVDRLLSMPDIHYLSEMMNFPGVLSGNPDILQKLDSARKYQKPVDGHAPGLRGEDAKRYADAGISTDHECFTAEEAEEKLSYGMKILVREGSAARNFDALIMLMHDHYRNMMFCSDDKHPDSLAEGHINQLCARAVSYGVDIFKVLQAACINPVLHYSMDVGLLKEGDKADFILVKDLADFIVLETYINGQLVASDGNTLIHSVPVEPINQFNCSEKVPADFRISELQVNLAIGVIEGQLITEKIPFRPLRMNGEILPDIGEDILKISVINRYHDATPAIAFIKNFGIQKGAIASSVAHDSHNIVAVGTDDESISRAVNMIIRAKGGISAVIDAEEHLLALPLAGLMSTGDGFEIADQYIFIDRFVKEKMGCTLNSPFMSLSFMALLVIPHLKLSDKGLFDGDKFAIL